MTSDGRKLNTSLTEECHVSQSTNGSTTTPPTHRVRLLYLLLIFFCHFISLYRSSVCWKKSFTLLPCSSLSVIVNTRHLDSRVRYSQMLGTGKTICSMVRSCRTICKHSFADALAFSTLVLAHCFFFFFAQACERHFMIKQANKQRGPFEVS